LWLQLRDRSKLAQKSQQTLFISLQDQANKSWKKKLMWQMLDSASLSRNGIAVS
jgi:hypothetical protein